MEKKDTSIQRDKRIKDFVYPLWFVSAIIICIIIAQFMDQMTRNFTSKEFDLVRSYINASNQRLQMDLNELRVNVEDLKIDVKHLIAEGK